MHKPRAEEVLFHDRKLALKYLKEQKIINKDVRVYKKDEDFVLSNIERIGDE